MGIARRMWGAAVGGYFKLSQKERRASEAEGVVTGWVFLGLARAGPLGKNWKFFSVKNIFF